MMNTHEYTFRDSQKAFQDAIDKGILNEQPSSNMYAGNYMYMFTEASGQDAFKHINTRKYIRI